MNHNEIKKQTPLFKKYFENINFNIIYDNIENVYDEYSDSDIINSYLNTLIDNFFLLNKKDEEIKLVFNFEFMKSINIDDLISCYTSEKIGKREKLIFDLFDNNSLKTVVTPKNSMYTRNLLLFILIKYYKQIALDFDKSNEEKLYKFLCSEMTLKDVVPSNENFNIFSSHIQNLYKIFLRKYVIKKEDNAHLQNINIANNSARISNNLNDELAYDSKASNNVIIIPNDNINDPNIEIVSNDTRDDAKNFLDSFLNYLITSNKDSSLYINNKNLSLEHEGNINSK